MIDHSSSRPIDQPAPTPGEMEDDELRRLIVDLNATGAPYPDCCLHALFAERAARIPEAVAVVDGSGAQLTYSELDRRANKLAHHLRALGVDAETLVGIAVTRSARGTRCASWWASRCHASWAGSPLVGRRARLL